MPPQAEHTGDHVPHHAEQPPTALERLFAAQLQAQTTAISAGQGAIVGELKEMRKEHREDSRAASRVGLYTQGVQFVIIVFLIAGLMLLRGVDPKAAAEATVTTVKAIETTVTTAATPDAPAVTTTSGTETVTTVPADGEK